MEEVYQIGPGRIRLMFTTERQQEVRQILSAYFEGKELPEVSYFLRKETDKVLSG